MNWTQNKFSYYSDFVLVPVLILLCLPDANWRWAPAGFVAWTFSEYAMHRWIFHRVMRAQHWIHHVRPTGYIAVSGLQSAAIHTMLMVGAFLTGPAMVGAFVGYELGYLLYIVVHDQIHHVRSTHPLPGRLRAWLDWRVWLHDTHHRGVEGNFGVVFSWWDHLFDTYCHPLRADAWLEWQRQHRQGQP